MHLLLYLLHHTENGAQLSTQGYCAYHWRYLRFTTLRRPLARNLIIWKARKLILCKTQTPKGALSIYLPITNLVEAPLGVWGKTETPLTFFSKLNFFRYQLNLILR